jgi:hypothetical protein
MDNIRGIDFTFFTNIFTPTCVLKGQHGLMWLLLSGARSAVYTGRRI